MRKKNDQTGKVVYSTDPDFKFEEDENQQQATLSPGQQTLRLRLDSKHRAGKAVTLVEGFIGSAVDLEELGKKLKTHCGTGGAVKGGIVIVQGDQREKLKQWLIKHGYSAPKLV
jgi:translation initiation factor 1